MYADLINTIDQILSLHEISKERQRILQPFIDFIQQKARNREIININFICTHNSRRSHLAQYWAHAAACYYCISNVNCYSGGIEETALFSKIADTLRHQGFNIFKIAPGNNPIYGIKYEEGQVPIIGFSKKYNHVFNPNLEYAAVMTCSEADEKCPYIPEIEKRILIAYDDPGKSDGTFEQEKVYRERSIQIGAEMMYVFSKIKT